MNALPFNAGPLTTNRCSFRPNSALQRHGPRPNPAEELSSNTVAARILVGFNVDDEPVWTIEDLVSAIKDLRTEQGFGPDATFYTTYGLYTDRERGKIVQEQGAQVLMLNIMGETDEEFVTNMKTLSEELAAQLEQQAVVLEIQRGGVTQSVWWVTP